jgi:hypothetical protein
LGFCVDCSNAYFNQELDPFTLERIKWTLTFIYLESRLGFLTATLGESKKT